MHTIDHLQTDWSSNTTIPRQPPYTTYESVPSQWPKTEYGWLCPRCGHVNAPWVRQCDCPRNNISITCGSSNITAKSNSNLQVRTTSNSTTNTTPETKTETVRNYMVHPQTMIVDSLNNATQYAITQTD